MNKRKMMQTGHKQSNGKLYIIAAPSGAGKTSLIKALVTSVPNIAVSVSYTTRPRRPGEQDGVDYHFTDNACFREMVAGGEFLEHAEVYDHYYGTAGSTVHEQLHKGINVILEIDWQGAQQVRQAIADNVSIYILPPSSSDLEQRLRARKQDSDEVIVRRMRDARDEISHYDEFDYVVVNDDFDQAVSDLRGIISGRMPATDGLPADIRALATQILG